MKHIEIAHEAPIVCLEEVASKTDYSYALVHLFEQYPEYFKFFQDELQRGRKVILDNSIFELGKAFDIDRYAYWIKMLKPTEYILPDALENTGETIALAHEFRKKWGDLPGKTIGVVQGKTYEEIVTCYRVLDEEIDVDKIAISFDYSYYLQSLNKHLTGVLSSQHQLYAWMLGRIALLERLLSDGVINPTKPHHLLGASLSIEFSHYQDRDKWHWIESLDTSNPVVLGYDRVAYDKWGGVSGKPETRLFKIIDSRVTQEQWKQMKRNIYNFRRVVTGGKHD